MEPNTELSGEHMEPAETHSWVLAGGKLWVNPALFTLLSPSILWSSPDSAPSESAPFYPTSPLWMQRPDWSLAAWQEERAAVLRPKTQTQPGLGQQWTPPWKLIQSPLDSHKTFWSSWASAERPCLLLLTRPPRFGLCVAACWSQSESRAAAGNEADGRLELRCGDAATKLSEMWALTQPGKRSAGSRC